MAYFDGIDDQQQTPDAEAEARRKVLSMIASGGKAPLLGRPQPDPGFAGTVQPGTRDYDMRVNSTAQPRIPTRNTAPVVPPTLSSPSAPSSAPLGGGMPAPIRPNVAPTREDYPAKPEVGGWKKYLGLGLAALSGPQSAGPLAERILHGQRDDANQRYTQATQDWERQQGDEARAATTDEARARAESLRHPKPPTPEKPENLQQVYADAVADAQSRGVDPAKDPKVQQIADAITSLQKQPAPPKDNKAVAGVLNGKPAWGVQTEKGWVDPQTQQSIPGFSPAPSFAETGLYEPVQVPVEGGGMAPGVFNRRTGATTPTAPTKAPIPKPAQKEIDESLNQARTMDRLDSAQKQILQDVEKRGQKGPLGGGPYLNGPESMQFLANHVAMTLGGIKGVRPGRDLIEAHVKARDLDQTTEALAQQVLAGGVITYSQAQQMLGTTAVNRKTIWRQAKQTAEQYGVPDAVKLPSDIGGGEPPTDKSRWQKNAKGEYRYSNDGGKTWNDYNQ